MDDLSRRRRIDMRVRALGILPLKMRRRLIHRLILGHWPNLRNPLYYSEVSTREILKKPDLLASIAGDKDAAKTYARGLCPELRYARTRWVGNDPRRIPVSALEGRWIVKLNAGSGVFARGNGTQEMDELAAFISSQQKDDAPALFGSRYYKNARQGFIIEDYIESFGKRPTELRYYCFGGQVELGAVLSFQGDTRSDTYVDRHGDPLVSHESLKASCIDDLGTDPPLARELFESGLTSAAKLAVGFGHVRVDLQLLNEEIWFGELTPFPASGLHRFSPDGLDREIAAKWRRSVES